MRRSHVIGRPRNDFHYAPADLASVAQFIAVNADGITPKEKMLEVLHKIPRPDFSKPDDRLECLRALAELPLPVYVTTNYDDLMLQVLKYTEPKKNPRREVCKWNDDLKSIHSAFAAGYKPDYANPVVFHLTVLTNSCSP